MDTLNSQHLTPQDGYIHVFRRPGEFTYSAPVLEYDGGFQTGRIVVAGDPAPEGKGQQHDVVLSWDIEARQFASRDSDAATTIRPNDFVVFHFGVAVHGQPPCFILIRQQDKIEADSRRLKTHDVFTHFFFRPGEYSYRLGKSRYQISVADHRSISEKESKKQSKSPLMITVRGNDVSVPHGRIVAGQSAVWFIEQGEGIHIDGTLG